MPSPVSARRWRPKVRDYATAIQSPYPIAPIDLKPVTDFGWEAPPLPWEGTSPNPVTDFGWQPPPLPWATDEPVAPQPSGMLRRALGDTAISMLGKGVIDTGEAAVGLANIPTALLGAGPVAGDLLKSFGYDPKAAEEALSEYYSPEYQAAQERVNAAKGFIPSVEAYVENPSTIVQGIATNLPSMLGAAQFAKRGLTAAAPSLLKKLTPEGLNLLAGSIGEGAIQAGQSAEQTRQNTGGLTEKQAGLSLASGAIDAAIAGFSGRIAQGLGLADPQVLFAGGKIPAAAAEKHIIRRVGEAAINEGLLQEFTQSAQEQILQNVSEGRPWNEGVKEAAAQGLVLGSIMGGAFNIPSPGVHPSTEETGKMGETVPPISPVSPPPPPGPPPGPETPPEFTQADLVRTVDSKTRLAPLRNAIAESRRRALIPEATLEQASAAQTDAENRWAEPIIDEAMLKVPSPATDPTVQALVLQSEALGHDPISVLKQAGVPNPEDVVNEIRADKAPELYQAAKTQAQDIEQSRASVVQRSEEEKAYAKILAEAVAQKSIKAIVDTGVNPAQAAKILKLVETDPEKAVAIMASLAPNPRRRTRVTNLNVPEALALQHGDNAIADVDVGSQVGREGIVGVSSRAQVEPVVRETLPIAPTVPAVNRTEESLPTEEAIPRINRPARTVSKNRADAGEVQVISPAESLLPNVPSETFPTLDEIMKPEINIQGVGPMNIMGKLADHPGYQGLVDQVRGKSTDEAVKILAEAELKDWLIRPTIELAGGQAPTNKQVRSAVQEVSDRKQDEWFRSQNQDIETAAHFDRIAARIREIKRAEPNLPHRVIAQRVNQEFGTDNLMGRGHEALARRIVDKILKGQENPKTTDLGTAEDEISDKLMESLGILPKSETVETPKEEQPQVSAEDQPAVAPSNEGAVKEHSGAISRTNGGAVDEENSPSVLRRNPLVADEAPKAVEAHAESVPPKAKETKYDFSSTQVDLPEPAAEEVRKLTYMIPDEDLAGDGRETEPHATVKYGLHTNDTMDVRKVLAGEPPIKVKFGEISTFPPSEGSDGAEVVKIDLDSPDLHRLNKKIAAALDVTDTHPDYKPHVTLAYVKPGEAKKYVGRPHALQGKEITLNSVTFSAKDGREIVIPLTGKPQAKQEAATVPVERPKAEPKPVQSAPKAEPKTEEKEPTKHEAKHQTLGEQPKPKTKSSPKTEIASNGARVKNTNGKLVYVPYSKETLETYFKPDRIVNGYGGKDKVLSFDWNGGDWNVTVQGVDSAGNPLSGPDGRVRQHKTLPDMRELVSALGKPTLGDHVEEPLTKVEKPEAEAAPVEKVKEPSRAISDVGEKLGGARKDLSTKTGPRAESVSDDRAVWEKRFTISQTVSSSDPTEKGKWNVSYSKKTDRFNYRPLGTFDTKEEAEAFVPIAAVADSHRVYKGNDVRFKIERKIGDRKLVQVVKETFETREDAMAYMAAHAEEILGVKTNFGEEVLPRPDPNNVARIGEKRREGDVTANDFKDSFGFRAVEFGNWNTQDERQTVMNHAYDSLLDLAETLGIPPKAISLEGELGLGFGSRGHGLTGARAHYERDYGVINLTKMKGAGALAHEWFHSLDHYFGRKRAADPNERVENKRGDKVFKESSMVTEGGYTKGVREEVAAKVKALVSTMKDKAEKFVEDTQKVERWVGQTRDDVKQKLADIRRNLAAPESYTKKPAATAEQLARFDALAEQLINGEAITLEWKDDSKPPAKKNWYSAMSRGRYTNAALDELSDILKKVRGRSGFAKDTGALTQFAPYLKRYAERIEQAKSASTGEEKTRSIPTQFAMNARSADQGRASAYWSTPVEMSARAFQSYVEDRLSNDGAQNDFLTFGTKDAVIVTPWGFVRPYPLGDERAALNAAFDDLFKTIQTKETDKGVAMFDRKPSAPSFSRPTTPFFSQLERAAEQMKQPMRGAEALRFLSTREGVKAAELKWTGLDDFLQKRAGERVTPTEIQEFLKANQVTVTEVTKGEPEPEIRWTQYEDAGQKVWSALLGSYKVTIRELADGTFLGRGTAGAPKNFASLEKAKIYYEETKRGKAPAPTKFGPNSHPTMSLPGGTNYREVLLTLPAATDGGPKDYVPGVGRITRDDTRAVQAPAFRSSHFDEPNILAHVRMNDRMVNGKKVLFVEEIQSDWAQKGRREGFAKDTTGWTAHSLRGPDSGFTHWQINDASGNEVTRIVGGDKDGAIEKAAEGIPFAPFVEKTEDWTALALKAILHKAAVEGYDAVTWTTGDQQNARYDLAKQVDKIQAFHREDGTFDLMVFKKGDRSYTDINKLTPSQLEDNIGKDLAAKIVEQPKEGESGAGWKNYEGLDLAVGGKGMREFYDRIIPQAMNKLAKKWGAKVGTMDLQGAATAPDLEIVRGLDGNWEVFGPETDASPVATFDEKWQAEKYVDGRTKKSAAVHSISISPEMRASIISESFPLFQRTKETTEAAWQHYDSKDGEKTTLSPTAYRDGGRINGAPPEVRVVDFMGDVDRSVLIDMANSSATAALSSRVMTAVRMIQAHVPDLRFGGFTPAGNLHGVNFQGRVFLNELATHQIALETATEKGITYHEAFADAMMDVILHEAAHYAEKGHGAEFLAELQRIVDGLGPVARKSLLLDFMKYASDNRNSSQNERMYQKALPGWREGERRGREAAARAESPGGDVRVGSDLTERLQPRSRSDTGDASGVGGEGDGSQGSLFAPDRDKAEGLAGASDLRGTDGRSVAAFERKTPAPPAGLPPGIVVEERWIFGVPDRIAAWLEPRIRDKFMAVREAQREAEGRTGRKMSTREDENLTGMTARSDSKLREAEAIFSDPIKNLIAKEKLDFNLLGKNAQAVHDPKITGGPQAISAVEASGKASQYEQARKMILDIQTYADDYRKSMGLISAGELADLRTERGADYVDTKEHPLVAALQDLERAIIQGNRNETIDDLAKTAEQMNDSDFATVDEEPIGDDGVGFKRAGQSLTLRFSNPDVAKAVKGLSDARLDNLTQTVGALTRWTAKVNTSLSPVFGVKNKIRDWSGAVLYGYILHGTPNGVSKSVAAQLMKPGDAWKVMRGVQEYLKDPTKDFAPGSEAAYAKEADQNGAIPGFLKQVESIGRIRGRLLDDLKAKLPASAHRAMNLEEAKAAMADKSLGTVEKAAKVISLGTDSVSRSVGWRAFTDIMEYIGNVSEMSTRVHNYSVLRKMGVAPREAANKTRNLLDFNRKGTASTMLGALNPFFNANVQGTWKLYESLTSKDPGVRRRAMQTMTALVAAGFAWGAMAAAAGGDGDDDGVPDSDQMPDWQTARNLVIPALGNLSPVLIPLAQGFSLPFFTGFMLSKLSRGFTKPGKAFSAIGAASADAFSPVSSPYGVFAPIGEIATNERFGGGPVVPRKYNDATPDSQLAWKNTSRGAKAIAGGLNRLTGGDEVTKGSIDVSPATLDHLARALTGGIGRFLSTTSDTVEAMSKGEAPKKVPFVSDFTIDTDRLESSRFYEQLRDIDEISYRAKGKERSALAQEYKDRFPGANVGEATLDQLRKALAGSSISPENRDKFMAELKAIEANKLSAKSTFDSAEKALKETNSMPADQREAARDAIFRAANRAYQRALGGKQ
jgi:2'-5' RNA ligase